MTVPALPTSTVVGPCRAAGMIRQASPPTVPLEDPAELEETVSSMPTPIARRASDISWESRERSGRRTQPGSAASAASTRARLVTDLDPGTVTVAWTAASAVGAGQRAGTAGVSVMATTLVASSGTRS